MGSKYPKPLTPAEKKNCVFTLRYKRINDVDFHRDGPPTIDVPGILESVDFAERYKTAVVEEESPDSRHYLVRVWDPDAVGRYTEDEDIALGNWEPAAKRCDEKLRDTFPGAIVRDESLHVIAYD